MSVLKLFLKKNCAETQYDLFSLDAKKITLLFEDGSVYDDYSKLIDYGISNDLVMKLHDAKISVAQLQSGDYDRTPFDEYEKLLINDFVNTLS